MTEFNSITIEDMPDIIEELSMKIDNIFNNNNFDFNFLIKLHTEGLLDTKILNRAYAREGTILALAIGSNADLSIIKMIFEIEKYECDYVDIYDNSLFHLCALYCDKPGRIEFAKMLFDDGVLNRSLVNSNGETPLNIAKSKKCTELIELFKFLESPEIITLPEINLYADKLTKYENDNPDFFEV